MLDVQRIADFETLARCRDEWNRLVGDHPFRRFEWLGNWAQTYLSKDQIYVLAARRENRLVGLLPLYRDGSASQGYSLRWLGSGEVCTDYLGVIGDSPFDSSIIEAFAGWLAESTNRPEDQWDLLHLENVDEQEDTTESLRQHLCEHGCGFHQRRGLSCWRIELPDDWDDYLAMISKSHRKKLRRIERANEISATQVIMATEPDQLERGMQILVDLHQKRRQSLRQAGCFASRQFSDFLHRASRELFDVGALRLMWVEVEQTPVAVEFQLAGGGITYAYQAGVAPDRMDLQPGRIALIATIRNAIEAGHTAFDFLRGDEPYKAHWRADCRPTRDIRLVAPKTGSQIRHGIWLAGHSLKGLVQSTMSLGGAST